MFKLHDEKNAPEGSKASLEKTKKNFGMIPNLERVMATSPSLLKGYVATWDLFDETSLTPVERQVVYLTANFENECDYCVPWHSLLAGKAGMSESDLNSLRDGASLKNDRLQSLSHFTRLLISTRGKVSVAQLDEFFNAGFTEQQALEVILGVAVKTMSNFTNSIAGTPLDHAVRKYEWKKPKIKARP